MLKAVLSNLDEVDEGLRSLYKLQEDGTHLLQVEGMSPKNKVDEFVKNPASGRSKYRWKLPADCPAQSSAAD